MSDQLEERLRDELLDVAQAVTPPTDLVRQVSDRLRRRNRRRGGLATATLVLAAAVAAIVAGSAPSGPRHSAPSATHHSVPPQPSPLTPQVVHGPALVDTMSGVTLRAIRSVVLPGGRTPINGMTTGDVFYGNATLSNGVDLGNFQRLVRVNASGQAVIAPAGMHAPTTPVAAYGEIWVADRHRLTGFDPRTLAVRRVVRLPGDLPGQVAAAGGYVWVAGWTHLDRVSPASGALLRLAPATTSQRYAGVVSTPAGGLVTTSEHLPDTTQNTGTLSTRNPVTGAVATSLTGLGVGSTAVGGVAGNAVWFRDDHSAMGGQIDQVGLSTLTLRTLTGGGNTIAVTVSDGLPWVQSAALDGTPGHGALFECLSPSTGAPRGMVSLRRFPGRSADALPPKARATVPVFFAAGPHETFAADGPDLVIYPPDPRCSS